MQSNLELRGFFACLSLLCVLLVVNGATTPLAATSVTARVRTLDQTQTDTIAHQYGTEWHAAGPHVVDFGPVTPAAPVAGVDQWLAQRGRAVSPRADVTGTKNFLVMRVYFQDRAAVSYYARDAADEAVTGLTRNVEDDLLKPLDALWQQTSYGHISIGWDITPLYQLPQNRSKYITDYANGDLSDGCSSSSGGTCTRLEYYAAIQDAVNNLPAGYDLNDYDGILVFMAETGSEFHRGQAKVCNTAFDDEVLPGVPTDHDYGCVVMSENPTETEVETYGRMGHEFGHAFQQNGPGHPSDYNNDFELMDANYPGQTGAFEKQKTQAFPGWLPPAQYIIADKTVKYDSLCIRALEYDPATNAVPQVIKAKITDSLYYLLSVRVRTLGDDLNPSYPPGGIPTEGLLIERVNEGAIDYKKNADGSITDQQIVTVMGKSGNRNQLWQKGDTADFLASDGIRFSVLPVAANNPTSDYYCVRISYDATNSVVPDVGMRPWRESPGNTYETTDIWIDSPLNGYGTYRYGMWNDVQNVPVPRLNGDIPAVESVNRLYARVRNGGTRNAVDIRVKFQITNPAGTGIAGSNGWIDIGSVDQTTFPALASLAPGAYTDVYIEWTPDVDLTIEMIKSGVFDFHTCVRVVIPAVFGESVYGNTDGDGEQENIFQFEATPLTGVDFAHSFTLRNDDVTRPITYDLALASALPPNWTVDINDGVGTVVIPPNELITVPVTITAAGSAAIGSRFDVKIAAKHSIALENTLADPHDIAARYHGGDIELGGVEFAVDVLKDTRTTCRAYGAGNRIEVIGALDGFEGIHQAGTPLRAYAQVYDAAMQPIILDDRAKGDVGVTGEFTASFSTIREKQTAGVAAYVRCIFPGTHLLASSASEPVEINRTSPPPLPTAVPWLGSQFHFSGALNHFIMPPTLYSDLIGFSAAGGRLYGCPPGRCPTPVAGIHGRGIRVSPAEQSLLMSTSNLALGGVFHTSVWAKRNSAAKAETLLAHGAALLTGRMFNVGFDEYGHVVCSTFGDQVVSATKITDTAWHHYRCEVDGPDRRVYIDGELAGTVRLDASTPAYATNAPLLIGRRADSPDSFDGVIDEINIFTSFSAAAAQLTTNPGSDIVGYTPISHLTFDDVVIQQGTDRLSCAGAACPVVSYPDPSAAYRPLERVAAIRFQRNRAVTISSTAPLAAGTDSTLQFWAHFQSLDTIAPLVTQSAAGRLRIYVASPGVLSFSGVDYHWPAESAVPPQRSDDWHHYAFVKQGGQLAIYIDGNQVATGPAPAGIAPFRVSSTLSLAMGFTDAGGAGEYAGIELANTALPAAAIAARYSSGLAPEHVSPTHTLTASPSPTTILNSPTSTATVPTSVFGRTLTALRSTATALAYGKATMTRRAMQTSTAVSGLQQTLVAAAATRWANLEKTDVAQQRTATKKAIFDTTRTATPLRIIVTVGTKLPTITAPATLTPTRTPTASRTPDTRFSPTASKTALATSSATPTASTTPSRTNTQTPQPTRTKIVVTESPTASATATIDTARGTLTPSNTATRTRTPLVSPTAQPFGLRTTAFAALPAALRARVLQHLADQRGTVGTDWASVTIGTDAIPYYRPDIGCCELPAYYEIPLYADATRSKPAGFVIVTNDEPARQTSETALPHDYPIAHWDSQGTAPSVFLLKGAIATKGIVTLWKLDTLSYVAVQNNQIVNRIGTLPALIEGLSDETFARYSSEADAYSRLAYAPSNAAGVDDSAYKYAGAQVTTSGPQKKDVVGTWNYSTVDVHENFSLYRDGYLKAFAPLIGQLKSDAARQWGIERRRAPAVGRWSIAAPASSTTSVIVPARLSTTAGIRVTDPSGMLVGAPVIGTGIGEYVRLSVTTRALASGELPVATVSVTDSTGAVLTYTFHLIDNNTSRVVLPVAPTTRQSRAWSSWTTWVAGTALEQRDYNQFTSSGCASGCGPTAWMMLFGWADAKSTYPVASTTQVWRRWNAYRAGGTNTGSGTSADAGTVLGGIAHKTNTTGNENTAILYIRGVVGTFCVSGSGATAPWDMDGARYYLSYVGTGMGLVESHNVVGYHEDRIKADARNEIAVNKRPVILGTGFLAHYPLAWKYQYRTRPESWNEGWFDGDDVVIDEQFYVNSGWGGSGNGWVSAGTWFAGRITP